MNATYRAVAHDLRRTLIHEYAHLYVAERHHVFGWVEIACNPGGGDAERHFLGRFRHAPIINARARRLIGLAGTIAELIDDDATVTSADVDDYIRSDVAPLSASDAKLAGMYTARDVQASVQAVRAVWSLITARAAEHAEVFGDGT